MSRLKLLNALTTLTPPAVFPVRSFTAKGICVHEPVEGLKLNRRSISGLEPVKPLTISFKVFPLCNYASLPATEEVLETILLKPFQFVRRILVDVTNITKVPPLQC